MCAVCREYRCSMYAETLMIWTIIIIWKKKTFCYFQAKKKFNESLSENAKLRDEIESLRCEHKRFETLFKKLEKELKMLRREMGEVIESSTQAYDQRWESNLELASSKIGKSIRNGSWDWFFMVDPLSYFSFHDWCNKCHGMCYLSVGWSI